MNEMKAMYESPLVETETFRTEGGFASTSVGTTDFGVETDTFDAE